MITLRLPDPVRRLSGELLLIFAVATFCWVLAHWTWRALAPAVVPVTGVVPSDWSASILAVSALGFARSEPVAFVNPAPAAAAVPVDGRVRLLGIARPGTDALQESGQALFKIDQNRILWLRAGDALEPGLVLVGVDADGVRLAQDGKEVRLPLRQAKAASLRPAAAAPRPVARAVPSAAPNACKLNAEQRSRAYVLRPEIIDSVMRERSNWSDLFKPSAEGLLVNNPGGTGAMLGLYGNDSLMHVDGARLSGPEDVLRLVLQPLARNESVIVTGTRGGQPREWIYTGMNCLQR